MLNNSVLVLLMFFSQTLWAIPNIPVLPDFPMLGEFNPNQLGAQFNKFTHAKPDIIRENRMVEQIADTVLDGDVEYLKLKNGQEVFSIYMESETTKPKGGVIILHNRGQHANWADTIKPLRVGLAEKGWHTLSVQMPVLGKNAKYYDYVSIFPYAHERIKAALAFYKERGIGNIVLIAHGCGAHMAMSYLDKVGDGAIDAFIGIGMGATDYKQKLIKPYPLEKIKISLLDIFAQYDFAGVKRLAVVRKPRLNPRSMQMLVKNANHYYQEEGAVDRLVNKIATWLTDVIDKK